MTARQSPVLTLGSGQASIGLDTSQRETAIITIILSKHYMRPSMSSKQAQSPSSLRRSRPVELISADIAGSRYLAADTVWVIDREVHVLDEAELIIEDRATILILNGVVESSRLRRAALIFDPGSRLIAERFSVRAGSSKHRTSRTADNGGLWFLGTYASGSNDGICVTKRAGQYPSIFQATSLTASHLGRKDPEPGSPEEAVSEDNYEDDIDGVKLIGVGPDEWQVSQLRSLHSGDDGFDITNSHIRINRLEIRKPTEDGLNVSSSRIEIRRSLILDLEKTTYTDRDLFDLETDEGASFVELPRGCWVRLNGVFGDELVLSSNDMATPDVSKDNETGYYFSGKLKADALVYSISEG